MGNTERGGEHGRVGTRTRGNTDAHKGRPYYTTRNAAAAAYIVGTPLVGVRESPPSMYSYLNSLAPCGRP